MTVYYAHSIHLYNTLQEKRDIELLESMEFEVLNPNGKIIQRQYEKFKKHPGGLYIVDPMAYFKELVDRCDVTAFRSHVDLKIPSGVMYEVDYAVKIGKPVFELPTLTQSRRLTVDETREYLKYNGQR